MENFKVKVNLQKLQGAFITELKGKTTTKRCLVIPIADSDIFEGSKGVYLNMTAYQLKEKKGESTHIVKQSLSSERYKSMTEEQRKELPIIGDIQEFSQQQKQQEAVPVQMSQYDYEDLPF